MKWLLDEMLPPACCELLARKGHSATSVSEAGLAGADDGRVFELAVRERRISMFDRRSYEVDGANETISVRPSNSPWVDASSR